ncbi:MAG TPA: hypothetical protein VHN20_08700 [Beijerinckiaceae bacterium]|nr:hypothetical protein [Beijerinckiaceae bacterium]
MNITREDCIGLCGLDEAEIAAIGEHEHVGDVAAAALADYLLHRDGGAAKIRDMMVDDLRTALKRHDRQHARELFMALRHFVGEHREELAKSRRAPA